MSLSEFTRLVLDFLVDHWAKIVLLIVGLVFGTLWVRRRARREWAHKQFFHRINVSLNTIDDGWLRLRTLSEKNVDDVFLNKIAVEKVLEAAGKTSEANPVLPLAKDDAWFLLNAVLNEISEQFAL